MEKFKIEILKRPTAADLKEINFLIPQTASKPHLFSMGELKRLINQGNHCHLAVARIKADGGWKIVGMAAVIMTNAPTGRIAVIEDVIVDRFFRGRGLGKALIKKLISVAKKARAKHIGLRADPNAKIANAMYKNLGFFKNDVVYYRMNLFLPKQNAKSYEVGR